ncbi:hypothetical protein Rvan_2513 [Rhodomicrobium vannielii ATCC 17100]|uniref:Uncharacterized protein n=1 Tax=Rhodomicrobium vannielii (strain ATCC 17100 / DSM 162 / LMG 4299 / NCIMB 10020 / ATH 3.1.1) TaxID=648757 RepID=E3I663_RHOVT|nr:hypothetical protein Rvan_2513 [Rhodomicrobium vannielii ATCC 17100]
MQDRIVKSGRRVTEKRRDDSERGGSLVVALPIPASRSTHPFWLTRAFNASNFSTCSGLSE